MELSEWFHGVVSGRRRGPGAALARLGLTIAEWPYTLAVRWRNHSYDAGRSGVHQPAVPVVSVGNLTLGGTGKTPMVLWLARWFRRRGVPVAVISRGYGAQQGSRNDEALELEHKLPDVPHLQNPDRVQAARSAVDELGCQLIILDDAFQHRRLARNLDLVMLDASAPFGYGHVFPRGLLREPVHGLARAHAVVLGRADMVDQAARAAIRREVARHAPAALWAEVVHAPCALVGASGEEEPVESLAGCPVAAFCGIGNPDGFLHTLKSCDFQLAGFRRFPDHHAYTCRDIEHLSQWVDQLDVAAVLCTRKDLVKIRLDRLGRHRLRAVAISIEFLSGRHELEERLERLIPVSSG